VHLSIFIQFDVSLMLIAPCVCCRYAAAIAASDGEEAGSGAEETSSGSQDSS
jgi:hypothetical protein